MNTLGYQSGPGDDPPKRGRSHGGVGALLGGIIASVVAVSRGLDSVDVAKAGCAGGVVGFIVGSLFSSKRKG